MDFLSDESTTIKTDCFFLSFCFWLRSEHHLPLFPTTNNKKPKERGISFWMWHETHSLSLSGALQLNVLLHFSHCKKLYSEKEKMWDIFSPLQIKSKKPRRQGISLSLIIPLWSKWKKSSLSKQGALTQASLDVSSCSEWGMGGGASQREWVEREWKGRLGGCLLLENTTKQRHWRKCNCAFLH